MFRKVIDREKNPTDEKATIGRQAKKDTEREITMMGRNRDREKASGRGEGRKR